MTLVGSFPVAPETDKLLGIVKSASYHSFEVSILCASDSLSFDGWKSILHITTGTNEGQIGSQLFAVYRMENSNVIHTVFGWNEVKYYNFACEANKYISYKMVVSADQTDSSKSIIELFVNNVSVNSITADKVGQYRNISN